MFKINRVRLFSFVSILFLVVMIYCEPAKSGVTQVTVDCPYEAVQVGDTFRFDVKVSTNGESAPEPEVPSFPGLTVARQSGFFGTEIINGKLTQIFRYIARANSPGVLTLSGISAGGVQANPVSIEVRAAGSPPVGQTGEKKPPIFVESVVDKTEAWQGQQITYEFYIYFGNMRPLQLRADIPGAVKEFISKEIESQESPKTTVIGNQRFNKLLGRRMALFPIEAKTYEIPSIRLEGQVQIDEGDPTDPFSSFFTLRRGIPVDQVAGGPVVSPPLKITVKPLPAEGRPDNFSGAVGQFSLTASIDKREVAVGEPFTLTVRVFGNGNPDAIAEPKLKLPDWVEIYETERQSDPTFKGDQLQCDSRYDFILIPRQEGQVTLEPVSFAYFDPGNSRYVNLSQGPFLLKVNPDKGQGITYLQGKRKRIRVTGQDFRHIRPVESSRLYAENESISNSVSFWTYLTLPWIVYISLVLYQKRKEYLERNPHIARKIHGKSVTRKRLSKAESALKNGDKAFYGEIENALYDFLSAQTSVSVRGLTRTELVELLSKTFAQDSRCREWCDKITGLIDEIEACRYSPQPVDMGRMKDILERVAQLLKEVRV